MKTLSRLFAVLSVAALGVAAASFATPAQAGRVEFSSEFHSFQVDLSMSPGEPYRVRTNVENKGSRAWAPADVTLIAKWTTGPGSPSGLDKLGFEAKVPRAVPSGLRVMVDGQVTAPSMPGTWVLTLRMAQNGRPFGEARSERITVIPNYRGEVARIEFPSKAVAGRKIGGKVTVKNTGQSDWDPSRVVLRCQVVTTRETPGENFFGKATAEFKLGKQVNAGESLIVLVTAQAKTSGNYNLKFYLWDAEDRDEIGRPVIEKVMVQ